MTFSLLLDVCDKKGVVEKVKQTTFFLFRKQGMKEQEGREGSQAKEWGILKLGNSKQLQQQAAAGREEKKDWME